MLFWFRMQASLEHSIILLFINQATLGLWLVALVLVPGTWYTESTNHDHPSTP